MNAKKARKIRKALAMSKENHTQKDYGSTKQTEKIVYFRNAMGDLVPRKTTRHCVINKNLNYYRKVKKALNKEGK